LSFPQSLLTELQNNFDIDTKLFLEAQALPHQTSIRLNPFKPTNVFENEKNIPWCNGGKYLKDRPLFILDPLWHAGAYYVQEPSSMFLQQALMQHTDFAKPLNVLDLCASPGGKSTLVASLINEESLLISNEVVPTRVAALAENMMKWGRPNTWVTNNDPSAFTTLENYFDIVLIDAPCSGSGLFRKDDNYINEWSESNVNMCSLRQQKIIADIMPALKKDGLLVYMTCSFSIAENEAIVDFISDTFEVENLPIALEKDWNIVETESVKHNIKGYRFYPHLLQGEGFYLSIFKKNDGDGAFKKTKYVKPISYNIDAIKHLICFDNIFVLHENDLLFAMMEQHFQDYCLLKKYLKIVRKGTLIGKPAKNKIVPEHDVALSIYFNNLHYTHPLALQDALQYLSRNDLFFDTNNKGWLAITYNNLPIGFVNHLGNRINNYYPLYMRIRNQKLIEH
jgi:16S rRNA C967 or C1407 C5-methylase (RsmB/RsmF family)/NOL1/NOP2/fmu family ribosome biogenesis protein